MDIMEQAIHKLDTELETAADDRGYLFAINQMVRALLLEDESYAEKVLEEPHTLKRAYKVMRHIAQKNRGGAACVCIAPDEAQDIIGRFYGFWGEPFDFDPDEAPKRPIPPAAKRTHAPTVLKSQPIPAAANKPAGQLNQIDLFYGEA
ncbi:Hypothetical protein LUCI_3865 [Lucifera butyrica]|uniref:Uncharacterized protein n=1 Tax=Lucifera butyrica TaxID=1351585 RepID=A0A498RCE8_9FIRM|nr:hypothetical protein [Lucifera butyrica]VBB08587.1 Hypothetical protein LUCI_3865 [Lucifera butyrica]